MMDQSVNLCFFFGKCGLFCTIMQKIPLGFSRCLVSTLTVFISHLLEQCRKMVILYNLYMRPYLSSYLLENIACPTSNPGMELIDKLMQSIPRQCGALMEEQGVP